MEIVTKIAPVCLALIMFGLGLGLTLGDFTGRNKYENPDYVNSPFYTTNDEIGYYTDWCKKNNYGGRKLSEL